MEDIRLFWRTSRASVELPPVRWPFLCALLDRRRRRSFRHRHTWHRPSPRTPALNGRPSGIRAGANAQTSHCWGEIFVHLCSQGWPCLCSARLQRCAPHPTRGAKGRADESAGANTPMRAANNAMLAVMLVDFAVRVGRKGNIVFADDGVRQYRVRVIVIPAIVAPHAPRLRCATR